MRFLFPICLLLLPLHAAESYRVFLNEESDTAEIRETLRKSLGEAVGNCEYITLKADCHTLQQAHVQARAIESGVTEMPSLVLADENGPYATLPLNGLTAEKAEQARQNKDAPGRRDDARKHRFEAHLFLLCAGLALNPPDDTQLPQRIRDCRKLLSHDAATPQHRQFIGLRLLYPLLMEEYRRGYRGAHTPFTEAKLLEAIAELEAARDIDRESRLGRQAHDERERLRAARRESRRYE